MSTSFQKTLYDVVLLLKELPRQRSLSESARTRFKRFEKAHRGVRCNLRVDHPPGSNGVDYDILLGAPDGGTVAVSWRADEGVPWAVQYSDHWAANYVLTVNKNSRLRKKCNADGGKVTKEVRSGFPGASRAFQCKLEINSEYPPGKMVTVNTLVSRYLEPELSELRHPTAGAYPINCDDRKPRPTVSGQVD